MLDFKELIDNKFSLIESIKIYKNMALEMCVPIVKTAAIAIIFIFFVQALLSLLTYNSILNVFFWFATALILCIVMASFFKTAEDIILSKTAQVYLSISHVLSLSLKLFAVISIIVGGIVLLSLPAVYIKNPLFSLPYRVIVGIFVVAALPFVYFAPLAVVLREASIIKSFIFSYYMTLERWSEISKSILVQISFVAIMAFWAYFIVSIFFFPNASDFLYFLMHRAVELTEQSRNLYMRFVSWEMMQIFIFVMVSGIFIGTNTVLFAYLDGSLNKIIKRKEKIKVNPKAGVVNSKVKYVDVLKNSKPFEIATEDEEEEIPHKKQKEALNEIYNDALNEDFVPQDETKNQAPEKSVASKNSQPKQ